MSHGVVSDKAGLILSGMLTKVSNDTAEAAGSVVAETEIRDINSGQAARVAPSSLAHMGHTAVGPDIIDVPLAV